MPEPTRQLAAIMFTDIVGYTALMGKDSNKALELVRQSVQIQKPLVEKHNGKWLKEMGDGAMAQFGSALDAVNCALEIQRTSRADFDADLRIGIHLGDITIENNDVYGDGVNVAARLESITDPGGIYISESIEKAIRGQSKIQAKFLGEVNLKNVDYGVRTYAIQGVGLPIPDLKKDKELSGRFLAEIKRRGVIRAGIMYMLFSTLLVLLLPIASAWISIPESFKNIFLTALGIGFPIALYLAWRFERSPEGFVRSNSLQSWRNPLTVNQRKPMTGIVVMSGLSLVIMFLFVYPIYINSSSSADLITEMDTDDKSIAVMPFRNDSKDADNLYFCNGLMEDVINQLAQIEEIRVPSVTSMLYYRENPKPYSEIVQELNVSYLLEASVRKLDDRALMTVTLIDADKNEQIWRGRYKMDLSVKGVWDVQFEVASEITKSLKLALKTPTRAEKEIPTGSFEAYDSYLKARELLRSWDLDQNRKAINELKHAINLDSDFQFAYASLAQAYGQRAELSRGPWVDSAKYFAKVALEIDSSKAETMIVMGYSHTLDGDPSEGLKWYDRAYTLNPKVQYLYNGWCHLQLGNYEEAVKWAKHNIEMDPKNSIYYIDMCYVTNALGLFDVAKNYAYKALKINPGFSFAYVVLRDAEFFQGNYLKALSYADSAAKFDSQTIEILKKGIIYYKLDSLDQALYFLEAGSSQSMVATENHELKKSYYLSLPFKALTNIANGDSIGGRAILETNIVDIENNVNCNHPDKSYLLAGCYASLGMIEKGIEHFNKSVEAGYSNIYDARQNALLDNLREHSEFRVIMKQLEEKISRMRKNVLEKGYLE